PLRAAAQSGRTPAPPRPAPGQARPRCPRHPPYPARSHRRPARRSSRSPAPRRQAAGSVLSSAGTCPGPVPALGRLGKVGHLSRRWHRPLVPPWLTRPVHVELLRDSRPVHLRHLLVRDGDRADGDLFPLVPVIPVEHVCLVV